MRFHHTLPFMTKQRSQFGFGDLRTAQEITAVLPVGRFSHTIGLFFSLRCGIFLLLRVAFFWASFIKMHAFFELFSRKIFLSKSIVFVNSAEVVRFVFT